MVNSQTGTVDIFQDEWKACLRAHYFHVIYEHDWKNERSLARVLLQTGITQDEISTWRAEALHEIGMDEKIAELEPQVATVEDPQVEISQSAELPDETQSEAVELVETADLSAEVQQVEDTELGPATEPDEPSITSESIVQAQMAFDESVDESALPDSAPEPPPSPPAEPPTPLPPPPKQMSLF